MKRDRHFHIIDFYSKEEIILIIALERVEKYRKAIEILTGNNQ